MWLEYKHYPEDYTSDQRSQSAICESGGYEIWWICLKRVSWKVVCLSMSHQIMYKFYICWHLNLWFSQKMKMNAPQIIIIYRKTAAQEHLQNHINYMYNFFKTKDYTYIYIYIYMLFLYKFLSYRSRQQLPIITMYIQVCNCLQRHLYTSHHSNITGKSISYISSTCMLCSENITQLSINTLPQLWRKWERETMNSLLLAFIISNITILSKRSGQCMKAYWNTSVTSLSNMIWPQSS